MKYYVTQSAEFDEDGLMCDAYTLYVGTSKKDAVQEADVAWEEYSPEEKNYIEIEVLEFEIDENEAQECDKNEIFNLCSMLYSGGEYKICHTISLNFYSD